MRALASLLAASLLAGCASGGGISLGGSDEETRDPYYKEWRAFVDGSHLKLYEVPVEAGARSLNVTLLLEPRTNGLPVPTLVLARLDVSLSDPSGAALAETAVDTQRRTASLTLDAPAEGIYLVQVSGVGSSEEVDGTRYGDAYSLVAEVLYEG